MYICLFFQCQQSPFNIQSSRKRDGWMVDGGHLINSQTKIQYNLSLETTVCLSLDKNLRNYLQTFIKAGNISACFFLTYTHTHTETHTQRHTHRDTHRHTHRDTHRDKHTERHTQRQSAVLLWELDAGFHWLFEAQSRSRFGGGWLISAFSTTRPRLRAISRSDRRTNETRWPARGLPSGEGKK